MKLNIQLFAEFTLEKAEGDASWKALQGKIVYTESNIDPVTNSSDLTVELWGRTWTGGSSGRYWSGVVSIDGEDVIKFSDMGKDWSSIEVGDAWVKFKSYTKKGITRDARGSKTINISGSLTAPSVTSIGGLTSSGDLDVSLRYIPRQSVISVRSSNATGKIQPYDTLTIDISRKSTRYSEEIVLICSDGTVFDRITTSEDSITYDIPLNMLNHMLDEINYLTITAFTYTADGGLVGQTNTESKEFVIPDYAVPTVTINSVTDANTKVPSNWGVFVKGKSRPVVNASASGYYGSEVTSMELKTSEDPSSIYVVENSTATITFPVVNAAGTITVVAVDNRGKVGSASQDYAVVDYEAPKLTSYSAQKVDLDGTPNDEGTYVLFSVDGTIASCLNKNVKEVYVGFGNASNIEWVMVEPGVDIILSDRTIDPFAKNTIYFKIKDSLGEEDVKTVVLKGIFKLFNFNKTLTALAIGKKSKAADNKNLFEVDMPTEFYQDIKATNVVSRNLFNKNNAFILNGALNAGNNELSYSNDFRTFCMKIKPNTTYTISKIVSSRFILGFYSIKTDTLPIVLNSVIGNNNATKLTVTSGATDNYLYVMYSKVSEDTTISQEDILKSIQVEEGSTASDYVPYLNLQENILTDSVARLKNVVSRNLFHLWEQGGISSSNGNLTTNANRLRTIDYTKVTPNIDYYISIKDTNYCFVNIILFDENNNYVGQYYEDVSPAISGTASLKVNFPNGCYKIKAVLKRVDDTELTPNDISVIKPQLEEGPIETAYVPYLNLEKAMQENEVYSTSEVRIGTWINGKPLYRKCFYIDSLPSTATTKTIATIPSSYRVVNISGCYTDNGTVYFPVNTIRPVNGIVSGIGTYIAYNELIVEVGSDRSALSGYVIVEYRKVTD